MRLPRLLILLMLLAALAVAGVVPATGSWSCPDGTACVYTAGRGFHCAGDTCRMACCAGKERARSCCGGSEHSAMPGLAVAGTPRHSTVGVPPHCRYREAPQAAAVGLSSRAAPDLDWQAVAVLPSGFDPPIALRSWERLAPIRGSPPRPHTPPLASPRAPPAPDCA
jgi:hypothetical protein